MIRMNIEINSCFEITWYMGFFAVIRVIIPREPPSDDPEEASASASQPATPARTNSWFPQAQPIGGLA